MLSTLLQSVCGSVLCRRGLRSGPSKKFLIGQYKAIKDNHKDYVVLLQSGDFYEIIGEDAVTVSSKTILHLSRRHDVPMVGFPVKSLGDWQRTLIQAGFQLAICNQVNKTPVKCYPLDREVVKLVTRGTLIEPLHNEANYLLSIATSSTSTVGLAWTDISTSEFQVSTVDINDIDESVERINPSEVLLRRDIMDCVRASSDDIKHSNNPYSRLIKLISSPVLREHFLTGVPASWYVDTHDAPETHSEEQSYNDEMVGVHFTKEREIEFFKNFRKKVSTLEACAMKALLLYVKYTHKSSFPHFSVPSQYELGKHMIIDSNTRRALELSVPHRNNSKKATLLGTMDGTRTAQGARLLANRLASPLTDVQEINKRLDLIELFCEDTYCMNGLISYLEDCQDLERSVQKVVTDSCSVSDLHVIRNTLHRAGNIKEFLESNCQNKSILQNQLTNLGDYTTFIDELDRALATDTLIDYIAEGYSQELDDLRDERRQIDQDMVDLANTLSETSGIRFSLVSYKGFMKVIEVTKSKVARANACPDIIKLDSTISRTRYTHPKLQKLNTMMAALDDEYAHLQSAIYKDLCQTIIARVDDIIRTASALAQLDVASSLSKLAIEKNYCRPTLTKDGSFNVIEGLHPVVANLQDTNFTTNSCNLNEQSMWLITGPNMGGKSTFLRQNAIIPLLAQMGSYVPARQAELGVVDRLFARVGATDNVSKNMSTFQVEMSEMSHILLNATPRSFVIIDELGRGTAFNEGLAIAGAVMQYIQDRIGCRCLMASHFHQLIHTVYLPNVANFKFTAKKFDNRLVFLYKIQPGIVKHSYALEVASLTGIPKEVITKAQELLYSQSTTHQVPETELSGKAEYWNSVGKINETEKLRKKIPHSISNQERSILEDLVNFQAETATAQEAYQVLTELKNRLCVDREEPASQYSG